MAHHRLTGLLLVGGDSRRFGSPKALARFEGETLAERAWRLLGEVCDERLAPGKRGELDLPFEVLDDACRFRAPLAGIVAGLRAAANERCFVLPVDSPLITAAAVSRLVAGGGSPQTGPLPGMYSKQWLPVLERRLAAGQLALRDALAELGAPTVWIEPRLLANVNEPSDLLALAAVGPR